MTPIEILKRRDSFMGKRLWYGQFKCMVRSRSWKTLKTEVHGPRYKQMGPGLKVMSLFARYGN